MTYKPQQAAVKTIKKLEPTKKNEKSDHLPSTMAMQNASVSEQLTKMCPLQST